MYNNSFIWWPIWRAYIDILICNYPDHPEFMDKHNMLKQIDLFALLIPCDKCKKNFNKYITNDILLRKALESRNELTKWFLKLHNKKNKENWKEKRTLKEYKIYLFNKYYYKNE